MKATSKASGAGKANQQMFRPSKSNKNSVLSSSQRTPASASIKLDEDDGRASSDFCTASDAVDVFVTTTKEPPYSPTGLSQSRNHPQAQASQSAVLDEYYAANHNQQPQQMRQVNNGMNSQSDVAAASPNSPPSRQSKVTNNHTNSSLQSGATSNSRSERNLKEAGVYNQQQQYGQKLQKSNSLYQKTFHSNKAASSGNSSSFNQQHQKVVRENQQAQIIGGAGQNHSHKNSLSGQSGAPEGKNSVQRHSQQMPSTLDPSNPLAHTTATRAKKQPIKERTVLGQKAPMNQGVTVSGHSTQKHQSGQSPSNFKMYSTLQLSVNSSSRQSKASRPGNISPKSTRRANGHNSPISFSARASSNNDQEATILHSQAMIQKSRDMRMNSGGRLAPLALQDQTPLAMEQMIQQQAAGVEAIQQVSVFTAGQASPTGASSHVAFDETIRDEVVYHLKQQLDDERKKHREMKTMFDNAVQSMEAQSRTTPSESITVQASKAVDEIMAKGVLSTKAMSDEIEKQRAQIEEFKRKESDLQGQAQLMEKQLMHAQMRVKESEAKEQIRQLQQETQERKLQMEIDKLKEQVKDLRNNEEQLKADHTQTVLELNDRVEEVRSQQAQESEEKFMTQINEIKQVHARERETLLQQKFTATQELQMIKMDHSELIRNTNFEEQRELIETITAQQAQIQHLQILLNEQKSNADAKQEQLEKERSSLEQKLTQAESSNATQQSEHNEKMEISQAKCKDLEVKLEKMTQEKDKLYKKQMSKIQENLESLKEQIASTNQSLIDQSMAIPQTDAGGFANNLIARLHSPDFSNQRHRRGEPISASSPRVPRAFARLNPDTLPQQKQRIQSPLHTVAVNRHREKSGDQNAAGVLSGSDMQEMTQMMSNGTVEQTLNLGAPTAGQALFNQTCSPQINGVGQNQNSFLLDPVFNDYYVEYVMLHKLQALTNNFTCQKCMQVLNFQKFFDEDHECVQRIEINSAVGAHDHQHQNIVRHSHIGSTDSIEEFKEARAMFGPTDGGSSRIQNVHDDLQSFDGAVLEIPIRQDSLQSNGQNKVRGQSHLKRNSQMSMGSMMKATAHAAATGASVIVTEINLAPQGSRNIRQAEADRMMTGSFQQSSPQPNLELSEDGGPCGHVEPRRNTIAPTQTFNNRHKVNAMQLEVYVQKIKEYRIKIEELEDKLKQCKQENDSLIDDLRDSKTKVAVLEEGKAQLQMEVTKLRKGQNKSMNNANGAKSTKNLNQMMNASMMGQRSPQSPPQTLNLTVNSQSYGVFGLGGSRQVTVNVPAQQNGPLQSNFPQNQQQQQMNNSMIPLNEDQQLQNSRVPPSEMPTEDDQRQAITPRNRLNQSDHKIRSRDPQASQQIQQNERAVFRSPQTRMVPLSQKFSAYPTSEFKKRGGLAMPGAPSSIYGLTRNGMSAIDLSMQSSQAALASRSFNNLTQQLNSSVQHLRCGRQTARLDQNDKSVVEETKGFSHAELLSARQGANLQHHNQLMLQQQQLPAYSSGNESCDISPENDMSSRRRQAHGQHQFGDRAINHGSVDEVEEVSAADLSSMNPLVTAGCVDPSTDRTENRCSLFEAQNAAGAREMGGSPQKDDGQFMLARSQKQIKLNNPYDEQTNRQRLIEDGSPRSPGGGDCSPIQSNEMRQTIFPGMNRQKMSTGEVVILKNAVPIKRVALETGTNQDNFIATEASSQQQVTVTSIHERASFKQPRAKQLGAVNRSSSSSNNRLGVESARRINNKGHKTVRKKQTMDQPIKMEDLHK